MTDILPLKNIKQFNKLPVAMVMANILPDNLRDEYKMIVSNYQGAELQEKLDDLAERIPTKMKEELKKFGCKLPTDAVDFYMTVGSYLFDVYCHNLPHHSAPLNVHREKARKNQLAQFLLQEDITLPSWAEDHIVKNMLDEASYPNTVFSLHYSLNGEELAVQVNAGALKHFQMIEQAAAEWLSSRIPMD